MTQSILIVDDEIQNRKLLEVLLEAEGYRTETACGGEEALRRVAERPPDLVLLDVMMPGMNGYEVATILKAGRATSHIPIIIVTAQSDRQARLTALNAGAEDFLTRPVDSAELWARVRNLLRLKALADDLQDQSSALEQQVQTRTAELQRFRSAMDATADAILLVNRTSMRIFEVNGTACKMLGYSRDEFMQLEPARLSDRSAEQLESLYDAVIAGQSSGELAELEIRRKSGSGLWVEVRRHAERSGPDWIIVEVLRDISERREVEKRLQYLAHFDSLTGLPNRTLFYDTLQKTVAQAVGTERSVVVLFIDLDHFKDVNDTLGHALGDELLVQVGNRLVRCLRIRDTVGRLGGDEFALILMMEDGQQGGAALVAGKIRSALAVPFGLRGREVAVTASIGITVYPDDASDPETLIKYADTAMYKAKQAGRDTFRFFTAQMNADMLSRLDLETAIRKAVENHEFVLYYQPKVDMKTGQMSGLEALLRWQRPGHGLVPPMEFIPVLEETGLIVDVGRWVIAAACRQIAEWARSPIGPIQVSVNVSGRQFVDGELDADVIGELDRNDIAPELLELELTEGSLMANTDRTIATLQKLKECGVEISIDDFGTGYSSLAYLRLFPIDKLKIDIAFVRHITNSADDAAIALTIIRMAHSLKLEAVAEGVETAAQLAYLRHYGCDHIQGYYFSPPVPVDELERMLLAGKCLPPPEGDAIAPPRSLLLLDADSDALGALSSLLDRDGYRVLAAQTGAEGLEQLALCQVQVIVCGLGLNAVSGIEFLERVKDLYPDALRIVVAGCADVESLADAVNRGAVYRFYGPPSDLAAVRDGIREAFVEYGRLHEAAVDDAATSAGSPASRTAAP